MNVKELIEELQKLPAEAQIIMQKDIEGNGFSPLAGVDGNAIYIADSSWSGEVHSTELSAEENGLEKEEWEEMLKTHLKCVVLFPVN